MSPKLICLFCTLLFSTIGLRLPAADHYSPYNSNLFLRMDNQLFDAVYDANSVKTVPYKLMQGVTHFGDPVAVLGVCALLTTYGNDDVRKTGKLLTSAFTLSALTIWSSKKIVGRRRPLDRLKKKEPPESFPSGHTNCAFVLATTLSNRYPRWKIPLYCAAGLAGFSRIYLGRHYPLDVLAGALVGISSTHLILKYKQPVLSWGF